MLYQFYIKAPWHDIDMFIRFAKGLKSTTHIGIDFSVDNGKVPNGLVNILCSEKDYEECFWWLKGRNISARVAKVSLKGHKNERGYKT